MRMLDLEVDADVQTVQLVAEEVVQRAQLPQLELSSRLLMPGQALLRRELRLRPRLGPGLSPRSRSRFPGRDLDAELGVPEVFSAM